MGSGGRRGWRRVLVASVVGALGLGLVGVAGAAAPVVRRVDDSSCPVAPPVYCTIQAAINAANPGDTILVKFGADGDYNESITINKRVNVVAGGDVTIDGTPAVDCQTSGFPPTVTMSGNGARLQGFRVINGCDDNILVTGNDNVVAANRVGRDCDLCGTNGITLDNGAQRNIVVANVVLSMSDFGILVDWAGPNNLLLHNVVTQSEDDGVNLNASKTTLIGNVVSSNGRDGGDGIDIDSSGVTGTALKGNVVLQNGCCNDTSDRDIEMHPQSQRPVLKGNTYERSAVDAGDN